MKIAIIDYGSGNLKSVLSMFKAAALSYNIEVEIVLTHDFDCICSADKIVLPGVGSYYGCARKLYEVDHVFNAIYNAVVVNKKPFLGICVGMQLLSSLGLEEGKHFGFDWIPGLVVRLSNSNRRVPHVGWDSLIFKTWHSLFLGLSSNLKVYYVHSYEYVCSNWLYVAAVTNYVREFAAVVIKDNIVGVQFHPEKSHAFGLTFCRNFINWNRCCNDF